ncbi:Tripeptidyl-peptidase [Dirofilaria immitis]
MSGTSMSSPNVTGTVVCLISALKAQNILWSPYLVRLALEPDYQKIKIVLLLAMDSYRLLSYFRKNFRKMILTMILTISIKSTRGTAGSAIWFMCLADRPMVQACHLRDYN